MSSYKTLAALIRTAGHEIAALYDAGIPERQNCSPRALSTCNMQKITDNIFMLEAASIIIRLGSFSRGRQRGKGRLERIDREAASPARFARSPPMDDIGLQESGEIMLDAKRCLLIGIIMNLLITMGTTQTADAWENATFGPKATGGEPLWNLLSASDAVDSNLSQIEMALVDASLALLETGIDGPAARAVLSNLTMADAAVVDCITIDAKGTVREVEPMSFEGVKGANLKWQKHVNDTINTKLYSGFHFIKAMEGLYAIDSEMPIFDSNGTFMGTVSLMFNNSRFFGRVLAPFQPGGDSKLWVSKADDGTILYETDPTQVLLNKSSSLYQSYPTLMKLFDRMSTERTGYGTYEFLDQSHERMIKKGCYWTSIHLKGTEMRLALTLELN